MAILAVRFASCLFLWLLGSKFLVNYSIKTGDLILNAVALGIVLDIDEAFFTLVPARTRNFMSGLAPLPGAPREHHWRGVDVQCAILTITILCWIPGDFILGLLPLQHGIQDAQRALCGGKLDFVYALDPNAFVYSSPTNPLHLSREGPPVSLFDTMYTEMMFPDRIPPRFFGTAYGNQTVAKPIHIEAFGHGVEMTSAVQGLGVGTGADALQHLYLSECEDPTRARDLDGELLRRAATPLCKAAPGPGRVPDGLRHRFDPCDGDWLFMHSPNGAPKQPNPAVAASVVPGAGTGAACLLIGV
mmetsp:Transcript_4257/g.14453  ORF Transcript_4257/g.14453 Transcript_4257/m.14453 type:complete len:302 (-) Transcript_4257:55-960(-)